MIGDIMLGRKAGETILKKGNDFVFRDILPFFQKSDYIIANLEAPFSSDGRMLKGKNPHLAFNINSKLISALKYLNLFGVTLANNHLTDFGIEGIIATITLLKENGIEHTGAGRDLKEALKPIILSNGIGIIAFNAFVPMCRNASKNSFGVAELSIESIRHAIINNSSLCTHYILAIHWGIDYYQYPIPGLLKFAKQILKEIPQVISIVGHHPHLVQPFITFAGKNIHLSLGNFVFDEPFPLSRVGVILHLDIEGTEIKCETYDFVEFNNDYRLTPLARKKKINEIQRLENIKKDIELNNLKYQKIDKKWIKILLFNTIRYGSMTAFKSLLRTYTLKEIITKQGI